MTLLTIGRLARRAGLRTSTLRYYEAEGLLAPTRRTDAGYRLYHPDAEQTLHLIRRAQRLGFSLADIRALLSDYRNGEPGGQVILSITENRFIELARQITELLVLRHEMELFLLDLRDTLNTQPTQTTRMLFDRLLDRVCADPTAGASAGFTLDWLLERTGCALAKLDRQHVLKALLRRHVHIWQEGDAYHILVAGSDPEVEAALQELSRIETQCHAHATPQLGAGEEGYLFTVSGEHAFLFAQLFLALEQQA
ncbi:MAG: MerR family transcriptional regulator [Anaerolineae bacterium]|nr:MerR family transcriptional regulator [Anaerolineae bacterium]